MGRRLLATLFLFVGTVLLFGPQAPAAPALQATFPFTVTFATAPTPVDTWYAPWTLNGPGGPSGSISWTVETTGGAADGSGNAGYYRAVRQYEGSSVQVLQYPVPAGTSLYVGVWMRCPDYNPAPGDDYWMEAGAIAGNPALPAVGQGGTSVTTIGQHFDDPGTGGAWTVFKKFDGASMPGPNHDNGNVWTWYYTAAPLAMGANTVINLGFKVGALYDAAGGTYQPPAYNPPTNVMDVGYDGLTVSDLPLTTPPATINPPPPGGSGGGGSGGGGSGGGGGGGGGGATGSNRDNDNGDGSFNDKCGCGTADAGAARRLGALAFLAAIGILFLRRR